MGKYLPFIKSAIKVLEEQHLLTSLEKNRSFYDEPQIHSYSTVLDPSPLMDMKEKVLPLSGAGYSFSSPELALAKSLGEACERLSCVLTKYAAIKHIPHDKIKSYAMDLSLYPRYKERSTNITSWVKGHNLLTGDRCYLPAQQIYFRFLAQSREDMLAECNSSGAAGGRTHEEAILNGLYELIERDAFLTIFLGKLQPTKIALSSLASAQAQHILTASKRYNLDAHVFDVTNDFAIPSFATILVDRTGLGPAITVGLGANLDSHKALLHALEESFLTRNWLRNEFRLQRTNTFEVNPLQIATLEDRGLYWSSPKMIMKLSFLLDLPEASFSPSHLSSSPTQELEQIISLLRQKNIAVYYADLTLPFMKKIGYRIYKVLSPQLQPLYLSEKNKDVRIGRLQVVSAHLGQPYVHNKFPHPFL